MGRQNKTVVQKGPTPKKSVKSGVRPAISDRPLSFNLANGKWLKSINNKSFTNKLHKENDFAPAIFELFNKVIPTVQSHWEEIFRNPGRSQWKHCHTIDNDKIDKVLAIVETIHGHTYRESQTGSKLWQFGISQGLRLVGIYNYNDNTVTPLFVDYHHLVYPSQKHNKEDHSSFKFCPYCAYK